MTKIIYSSRSRVQQPSRTSLNKPLRKKTRDIDKSPMPKFTYRAVMLASENAKSANNKVQ